MQNNVKLLLTRKEKLVILIKYLLMIPFYVTGFIIGKVGKWIFKGMEKAIK
jgi:uncharacterized membrane protein YoaK (UPF0700 family)